MTDLNNTSSQTAEAQDNRRTSEYIVRRYKPTVTMAPYMYVRYQTARAEQQPTELKKVSSEFRQFNAAKV